MLPSSLLSASFWRVPLDWGTPLLSSASAPQVIRHYHGHLSACYALALHPTIDVLVTAGRDSVARVWDIRTKAAVHTLAGHTNTVASVVCQATDPQVSGGWCVRLQTRRSVGDGVSGYRPTGQWGTVSGYRPTGQWTTDQQVSGGMVCQITDPL